MEIEPPNELFMPGSDDTDSKVHVICSARWYGGKRFHITLKWDEHVEHSHLKYQESDIVREVYFSLNVKPLDKDSLVCFMAHQIDPMIM